MYNHALNHYLDWKRLNKVKLRISVVKCI